MLLKVTEILRMTFSIYGKNWRTILPYIAVVFVPGAVLALLGLGSAYLSTILPTTNLLNSIITVILSFCSWFISFWAMLALAQAIKDIAEGRPTLPWKQGMMNIKGSLIPVFWVSFLTSIFVGLWTLLLIIPGIIFSVYYVFGAYATLFDGQRGLAALRYSKQLVKGRWWAIAWRVGVTSILFGLLVSIIILAFTAPFTILISMNSPEVAAFQEAGRTVSTSEVVLTMVVGVMSSLASAFAAPLATIAIVLIYLDVRSKPVPVAEMPTASASRT